MSELLLKGQDPSSNQNLDQRRDLMADPSHNPDVYILLLYIVKSGSRDIYETI